MKSLQTIESLCKDISIQQQLYREASEKDENFEVKKKILVQLRQLEKQLNELKQIENVMVNPD